VVIDGPRRPPRAIRSPRAIHVTLCGMSVHEEVEEHAHHAKEPFDKRVAATMAIIAAMLAVVSVTGHILTTEELLDQQKASDQWSYYQAKSIRRFSAESTHDILIASNSPAAARYGDIAERYKQEGDEIQKKAEGFEEESHANGKEALRAHVGEVFLEIAIVFSSLAILTRRKQMYWGGVVAAIVGLCVAASALLLIMARHSSVG
jgi:hypothetical protein